MERIHISILSCDIMRLSQTLDELHKLGITHIHIDIADTSFTNNVSFGPDLVNQILMYDFVFDIHIMINNPSLILSSLDLDHRHTVFLHTESINLQRAIQTLLQKNCSIGLAYKRESEIKAIPGFVKSILILAVDPGKGGQMLDSQCIDKISDVKRLDPSLIVGFDGGVKLENRNCLREADFLVVGSDFFNAESKEKYLHDFLMRE